MLNFISRLFPGTPVINPYVAVQFCEGHGAFDGRGMWVWSFGQGMGIPCDPWVRCVRRSEVEISVCGSPVKILSLIGEQSNFKPHTNHVNGD